jgi:hypothetical protein
VKECGSSGCPGVGIFYDFVKHTEFNGKGAIVVEGILM